LRTDTPTSAEARARSSGHRTTGPQPGCSAAHRQDLPWAGTGPRGSGQPQRALAARQANPTSRSLRRFGARS